MRPRLAAALILALTSPTLASPTLAQQNPAHHLSQLGPLRALHGWTRATNAAQTLVFVDLENRGETPVLLQGAASDIAQTGALVGFQLTQGQPGYAALPPLPLAPGSRVQLAPDGLALRLTGLTRTLRQGDEFSLDLQTSLGVLKLYVVVEAEDAHQHSHAGHTHRLIPR